MDVIVTIGIIFAAVYIFLRYSKSKEEKVARGEFDYSNATSHPVFFNSDYNYSYKDSVIAIKKDTREILLATKDDGLKIYSFDRIKSWRFNLQSGGMRATGGMAGSMENLQLLKQQKESSGFFVSVKDIDHPEWRIGCDPYKKDSEREMKKWMEIFDQYVNNNY